MKLVTVFLTILSLTLAREGFGPGDQDWGYVDVHDGAHMFWWLYYTTADVSSFTEKPLIIWLQGGPGASSAGYGNFAELGPLDLDLKPRNYTWVRDANVLFIDNPVGSGFSYVDQFSALNINNREVAQDLVELMRGFYKRIPEFKDVPLYITAESYGGKMAAEFALVLLEEVKAGTMESNLKGVGLGDSWISPIDSVLTWAPFLLHMGAVDQRGYEQIEQAALKTKELLDLGQFEEATDQWGYTEYVIMNVAHNVDFYNVLKKIPGRGKHSIKHLDGSRDPIAKPSTRDDDDAKLDQIMNVQVKKALDLHVRWGAQSSPTFTYLSGDFMKPNTDVVELLLNNTSIKVYVFTGQLDLIVDTPGTVQWVDRLSWTRSSEWRNAPRRAMEVAGYYEGYVKEVGNLGLFWVNRAGHMVPADNPSAMDFILRKLTDDYEGLSRLK